MRVVREIVRSQLKQVGYDVKLAQNGREAIKEANSEPPDLIILDIMMPEIDGYEVLRQLKESDATKDIPVIFLTAETQEENIKKGIDLVVNDYVLKPFNSLELHRKIQRLLNQEQDRGRNSTILASKRKFKRFKTHLKSQFFLQKGGKYSEECTIIDISREGIGIEFQSDKKIDAGSTLHLEIFVPTESEPISVTGILKWIKQRNGGIKLIQILDENKWTKLTGSREN